jgi:hypothetical protein
LIAMKASQPKRETTGSGTGHCMSLRPVNNNQQVGR